MLLCRLNPAGVKRRTSARWFSPIAVCKSCAVTPDDCMPCLDGSATSPISTRARRAMDTGCLFQKAGRHKSGSGRNNMLDPVAHARKPTLNEVAAERLREAASLLAHQGDIPFRVAAYRRAADAVNALDTDLRELFDAGGVTALTEVPGVGPRIAGGLAELMRTGRWTYLERLRGAAERRDVFCAIPGVGPILAKRLHETLHVETLE